jgi:hypothetical protein
VRSSCAGIVPAAAGVSLLAYRRSLVVPRECMSGGAVGAMQLSQDDARDQEPQDDEQQRETLSLRHEQEAKRVPVRRWLARSTARARATLVAL